MAVTRKHKIFLLWWWYKRNSRASKRRFWMHPVCKDRGVLGEFKLLPQILTDEDKCLEYFRMRQTTFQSLLQLCANGLQKQNTNWRKSISPRERLVVTLRYRHMMQWQDTTLTFYTAIMSQSGRPDCLFIDQDFREWSPMFCHKGVNTWTYDLCEHGFYVMNKSTPQHCSTALSKFRNTTTLFAQASCPNDHVIHTFLVCDLHSACFSKTDVSFGRSSESWALPNKQSCGVNTTSLPPSFTCASGKEHVPFTLVCDHRQDCLDNSDEGFCFFSACDVTQRFQCRSEQCIAFDAQCDGFVHCLDESDEDHCSYQKGFGIAVPGPIPAIITLNGRGSFSNISLPDWTAPCPDTHFKCLSIEFCMPVYLRCNGANDCPEKEDEEGCDDIKSCPGFYRCRGFRNTFLHPDHLCDGWPQCPQQDDERFCNLTCPAQCSCLGHSWFCRQIFQASMYQQIRFLDAKNSEMKPSDLIKNIFLVHLSLSNCGLVDLNTFALPNLHSLDLEGNQIRVVTLTDLKGLPNLNTLFLTGNPLASVFVAQNSLSLSFPSLTRLDLSDVKMGSLNSSLLVPFPNLQTLNCSGCGIESITRATFQVIPNVRVLDLRGCRLISFSTGMLKPLVSLSVVRADSFKVCCPATLPDNFRSNKCESPEDKIASCNDLFKSNLHRVSWNLTASLALMCNMAILFKRLKGSPKPSNSVRSCHKSSVDAFVTSLFVCGCVHAVYMIIIGIADASYRGIYMLNDTAWKHGPLCTTAGFLWLLSLEISLFLVGLITLDRVLVSWRHPAWRFSRNSAVAAICLVILQGAVIALMPLLSRWKLFQLTALCSPLFLTSQEIPGDRFHFGVFSVLNVTVSSFTGLGQLSVSVYLHRKRFAFIQSPDETKELSTSRRLMPVVMCDAVCWLVIGHSSYLVAAGMKVPDNVVVVAQVLVMPFNWTLKPVLHAVAALLERRRHEREERMLKILIAKRHN